MNERILKLDIDFNESNKAGKQAEDNRQRDKSNEKQVWHEFLEGSNSALSYLYRSNIDCLYKYGRQFGDEALVLDSIQDVFFELIKSRKRLSMIGNVKAYLFACLRRRLLKSRKLRLQRYECDLNQAGFVISTATDGVTPMDQFMTGRIDVLTRACNKLPERQREAILLRYYEKLPYDEIANIMGIGKATSVRMLVSRALASLKGIMKLQETILLMLFLIKYKI